MNNYNYLPRRKRKARFPWRVLWLLLVVVVLLYFFTPWNVKVSSDLVAVPVVQGVQKNYEASLNVRVNKPGLVSITLKEDAENATVISHGVVFVWNSKTINLPFTIDKASKISADISFFKTSTTADVGMGVSLADVYVMGSYYQGKVSLYEKPQGYPTFKVVGTATSKDGFIPLSLLKQYGFQVQKTGHTLSWNFDDQIRITVDLDAKTLTFSSIKYADLSRSFPLSGSLVMDESGNIKGNNVILPMPQKVAAQLGAKTFPQVSLVLHGGYFTVQDTPIELFTYIDQFATSLLDRSTFDKDNRASALYEHVDNMKLQIEEYSKDFSGQWVADRKDTENLLSQVAASANKNTTTSKCSLISPIPNPIVTSGFGNRMHPLLKVNVLHSGIDILAMAGYPARAAADGEVIYTGYRPQWGYFAVFNTSGCVTVYAHLLRLPQDKDYVQGQTFVYTGASGFVTGPHLHFEVRFGGKPVDPSPFIGVK